MTRDFIDWLGEWVRRLMAVVMCLMPRRHWDRFGSFPLANIVVVSASPTRITS